MAGDIINKKDKSCTEYEKILSNIKKTMKICGEPSGYDISLLSELLMIDSR